MLQRGDLIFVSRGTLLFRILDKYNELIGDTWTSSLTVEGQTKQDAVAVFMDEFRANKLLIILMDGKIYCIMRQLETLSIKSKVAESLGPSVV